MSRLFEMNKLFCKKSHLSTYVLELKKPVQKIPRRRPGLVGMGWDLQYDSNRFESQHHILDGIFPINLLQKLYFLFEKDQK